MAATTTSQPLHFALYLLLILHTLFSTCNGYTTHLIHRDSPQSPFYNASATHFDRMRGAFRRSLNLDANIFKSAAAVGAPMKPGGGEYLMKMSIGTPPVELIGIADTGSDLTWTQCLPCINCYRQNIPLFDPSKSSSYKGIACVSDFCQRFRPQSCDNTNPSCEYLISYGDGSHSKGSLANETVALGIANSVSLPNIVFGCGHDTGGIFDASGSGIIGLSRSDVSLVSQLGGKKFAYCLVPSAINANSIITFGHDSVVSGLGAITTPIAIQNFDTHYYLTLDAISVGAERIAFVNPSSVGGEGNILIDSGTTLTLVPIAVHSRLVSALDKVIGLPKVNDPNGMLSPCYKRVSVNMKLPMITAHFRGGDVKLKPVNTFSWVEDDVVCFTMHGSDGFAIYGNLAQMNFLVGYDIMAGTVSFKPTDCTKATLV